MDGLWIISGLVVFSLSCGVNSALAPSCVRMQYNSFQMCIELSSSLQYICVRERSKGKIHRLWSQYATKSIRAAYSLSFFGSFHLPCAAGQMHCGNPSKGVPFSLNIKTIKPHKLPLSAHTHKHARKHKSSV